MNIAWIIAGLLFLLSIVLIAGKGSFLIAGYNTLSNEKKEKYDKKKLSRAAGVMLLFITIAILLLTLINNSVIVILCTILIPVSVVATVLYMNMKCKIPVSERGCKNINSEKEPYHNRNNAIKMIIGIGMAVVIVIVIIITSFIGSKPTVYTISNGTFTISTEYGESVKLSDIKSVQLKTDLPANLSRVDGYGVGTIVKGKCTSDIGNVTVYIDTAKPPFIYLETKSGLIILCDQDKAKTQALYDKLNSNIKQ